MRLLKISSFLLILILGMFFVTSCSKDTKATAIISPDQVTASTADWILIAGNWVDPSGKAVQSVKVYPTNITSFIGYTLVLKIDGVELPLIHDSDVPYWSGTADLEQGQTYDFHVFITDPVSEVTTEYSASAKMVDIVEAQFPDPYHLNTNTPISWTLAHDSQYQQVYVTSSGPENQIDEYEKRVDSNLRTFTIPANCVDNYGSGSVITLEVNEFNYTKAGKLALFTASSAVADYPVAKNGKQRRNMMERIGERAGKILEARD
jgi:hypothetical protein